MRPRRAGPLAVLSVLVMALSLGLPAVPSSAQGNSTTIPVLRIGINYPVTTLDPTKDTYGFEILPLSLENLFNLGPSGQLEPALATSFTQTSPVTYVYHIRHGVKFWDGDELTAADVAYSWNYYRAPGSQAAYPFSSVKNVVATSTYDVTVTLKHPDASWQYAPTQSEGIFEMKFAEEHKGTFGKPGVLIMGTGPWEVDSLDPTKGAELSANPDWWGGKVPIARISFSFFSTETSLALAFRAGEIDLDPFILDPRSFSATAGTKLLTAQSCTNGVLSMNTQVAPWSDVHVRRAVAYALNRPDIIIANGGYASPVYTVIPPSMLRPIASQAQINALLASLPLYPYSVSKAKAELAQSTYPNGFSATLLEYTGDGEAINESQVIAAELAKIGINVTVKADTISAWAANETGPAAQRVTSFSSGGCGSPDPSWFTYLLGSWNAKPGEWNMADYDPPAVDSLIRAGVATTDPAKRFEIYSALLQRLQADVPYVALYVSDIGLALSSKFAFPEYNQYSTDGPYALDIKAV